MFVVGGTLWIESQNEHDDKIVIHWDLIGLDSKYVNSIFIVVPHF